jgi:glucose/mannose-6-phosphate isomerase
MRLNPEVLDDPAAIAAGDPADMLSAVATAGDQVRCGAASAEKAGIAELQTVERPRVVVVAGMGGSAAAGDVLAAIAGAECPVPIVVHRGYGLPGWVGPTDLVIGVSSSGRTEETLSAVAEANRRGARLVTIGGANSPLTELSEAGHGLHIPVEDGGRQPRACIWSLAVPMLLTAEALGLVSVDAAALEETADLLDAIADRCAPSVPLADNPAKALALHLAGGIPVLWGVSDVAGAAAHRFACQINENAKLPAMVGTLSEPHHNQVVAFDGPLGRGLGGAGSAGVRMHLVVLRDSVEHPQLARRGVESVILADECGVPVTDLRAQGSHPVVRLASLVGLTDFASVYLALTLGIDPTPVEPIVLLKSRLAR